MLTVHMYFMQHHKLIRFAWAWCRVDDSNGRNLFITDNFFNKAFAIVNYVNILQSPVVVIQIYLKFNCTLKTLLRLGISRPDLCGDDSLSVTCRLYNLWSPFKIPFYLVPLIVFMFSSHTHSCTWGSYAAFNGMTLTCSMITTL
jgi:hypothetical protein